MFYDFAQNDEVFWISYFVLASTHYSGSICIPTRGVWEREGGRHSVPPSVSIGVHLWFKTKKTKNYWLERTKRTR